MSKLKATFCRHLHATWLDAVGGWPSAAHGLETDAQYRQAVSGMHNLLARLQKLAQDWFESGEAFIQARNNARDEKRKQVREEKRKYEEIKRTIQNHETLKKKLAEDLHALLRTLTNLTPLVEPHTLSEYVRVRCGCSETPVVLTALPECPIVQLCAVYKHSERSCWQCPTTAPEVEV